LHVGDEVIETTDNHPFWVEGKGWIFADELEVGDKLQKADGSNLTIDKVEFVKLDKPVTVYNFTVADFHTYYVTDIGIWVHNTNCGLTGSKIITNPITKLGLPQTGKIRFVPPRGWNSKQPLHMKNGNPIDKFGNEWRWDKVKKEWDVQLSKKGKSMLGWASNSGKHINVSPNGRITH
jgi:hypothetical protein